MMRQRHLFTALDGEKIVGGAIVFVDRNAMYIGRIFVDPDRFRSGCGTALMAALEGLVPEVEFFRLDTPVWNVRTNSFYKKLGYTETGRDEESVYYQKKKT